MNIDENKKLPEFPADETIDILFGSSGKQTDEANDGATVQLSVVTDDEDENEEPARKPAPEKPKREPRKKKTGSFNKDMTVFNIVLTIVTVIVNILVISILFGTTRFSALDKDIFIKVNLIVMFVLILIDVLIWLSIRTKKIAVFVAAVAVLIISSAAGVYGAYAMNRVDTNLDTITAKEHNTDINTSLVIYTKSSGGIIMDVEDLEGKKIGVVEGTDAATLGKERIKAEGLNVTYSNYLSFAEAFKALVSEEIDCAVLPANYANAVGTEEQLEPFIVDTAAILTFTESVVQSGTDGAEKDLTSEPFTVLISGENEGLADTIIIVSVNPVSMKITMTSIARDSFVPITCYNYGSSKINSAHAVSEACLVDTVTYMTGIDIDYTVEFNFASVIQVVDAVGGVDVYNPIEFMGQCWDVETDSLVVLPIPAGDVHLNGQQALGFVRERYAFEEGDFARQQHQQEVIEQIVKRVMDTRDPNTYLKILDAAGANIRTNLSTDQMVQFISYAMKKARRYYAPENPVGVMNIINSRIAGWAAQKWDDSLAMYLYVYFPFDGASIDTYNYVARNTNLWTMAGIPQDVSWSAAAPAFEPPAISAEWYAGEVGATVIGGPPEPTPEATTEAAEPAPVEEVPAEPAPAEEVPAEPAPAEETPAEQPAEPAPAEEAPAEQGENP